MNFDCYFSFMNKEGKVCPGVVAKSLPLSEIVKIMGSSSVADNIDKYRATKNEDNKKWLPGFTPMGRSKTGRRLKEAMEPTQYVMIDIDKMPNVDVWPEIKARMEAKDLLRLVLIAYITASGYGIRIIFRAVEDFPTVNDHIEWMKKELGLDEFGVVDPLYDLSRLSFLGKRSEVLYLNDHQELFKENPIKGDVDQGPEKPLEDVKKEVTREQSLFDNTSVAEFSEDEIKKYDNSTYRGISLKLIVEKYVEHYGKPESGEIHNYYNEMVKNFRCITDNDKRWLLFILPRFGHSVDECWSQINSICRTNTLSALPKKFYFFLKDNGFYEPKGKRSDDIKEYMMQEDEPKLDEDLPWLPPVFREIIGTCPKDFYQSCMDALLPIMGTLTSYLQAEYPYDGRMHTTSFFSVIYAPAGTGKGFVERFIDLFFEDLKLRDFISSERENLYLQVMNRKGANDKAPEAPHVSLRLIPPKNSEAEFLMKQRDNCGYHMFTYAAEMDSWSKGVKAAGGNKDDMIRIAWDNGEYGQQFRSYSTFKGMVRLYWNVLITGTIAQVENYFRNVENGLVTRCSFSTIENQEFAMPALWKKITKRGMETIKRFMKRCDENTYTSPCDCTDIFEIVGLTEKEFDEKIDWHFKFRDRKTVDMSWLMPTIDKFNKENLEKSALDLDRARDVFRRRCAVRGFRLGIMCYALWDKPRASDLAKCIPFIEWWMSNDLESSLRLWGAKYNELTDESPRLTQRSVFHALPKEFTRSDVYNVCVKQGIKTPVRRVLHDWKRLNYIEQKDKDLFIKK